MQANFSSLHRSSFSTLSNITHEGMLLALAYKHTIVCHQYTQKDIFILNITRIILSSLMKTLKVRALWLAYVPRQVEGQPISFTIHTDQPLVGMQ